MSDLQKQVDTLSDQVLALDGVIKALICALNDAGIPLQERIDRHLCRAANELEDYSLPEASAFLDEQRDVVGALLQEGKHKPGTSKGDGVRHDKP